MPNFFQKHHFFALIWLCACASLPASLQAEQDFVWKGASFSAQRIEYQKELRNEKTKSRVFISRQGMREETTDHHPNEGPYVVVIVNFQKGKTWMLAPDRKIYVNMPEDTSAEDEEDSDRGGLFSDAPCAGFSKSKKFPDQQYGGREVEAWACHDPESGFAVKQYFDPKLKMVVREETSDGFIEELHKVKTGKLKPEMFKVPAGFRLASMKEFFTGVPEFSRYEESGDENKISEKLLEQPEVLPGYKGRGEEKSERH